VAQWKLFRSSSSRLHALDGLLLAAIVFAISAIVIPDASSTGAVYVANRISLYSSLMLVAWMVSQLADLLRRLEGRTSASVKWAGVVALFLPHVSSRLWQRSVCRQRQPQRGMQ
jgi:hypothetical protein